MQATLTFLGSGTSMGVPTLGCPCAVCADAAQPGSRNRRTRPSVRIDYNDRTVLIDTGPDFHAQAIRENLRKVDAVFYTHHHADHILGMDDLRPLSFRTPHDLPLYADANTVAALRRVFGYTFRTIAEGRYPTSARVALNTLPAEAGSGVELFGALFQRIPVIHGRETITGYRFGNAAYLTDMSDLPPESLPLLQGLDVLVLDALRHAPHPSHSHLQKSIDFVELLKPRRAYFTHMSHELDHVATEAMLPPHIRLAYDGLKIHFDIQPTTPMKIFRALSDIPADFGPTVATIGNFDGVHRGHRWVIDQVNARARTLGLKSLALTFDPHPVRVLRPERPHSLITPLEEKLEQLATTGIDATLVLPFTPELSRLSAEEFARDILRNGMHAQEVHEGENFRFGYNAAADMQGLSTLGQTLGFNVQSYAPHVIRRAPISSSRIRTLISDGKVSEARALLGRPFMVRSTPASGRGFGTRYTVPTINLAAYPELLPGNGVYITTLTVGQVCFEGVTNVGNRPTFGADSFTVETHLFDFTPIQLTETTPLELTFLHRLRPELRWPNPEALRTQIALDIARAKRYFQLIQIRKNLSS